jgi:sRNA-binding regulator protein Hfq
MLYILIVNSFNLDNCILQRDRHCILLLQEQDNQPFATKHKVAQSWYQILLLQQLQERAFVFKDSI